MECWLSVKAEQADFPNKLENSKQFPMQISISAKKMVMDVTEGQPKV